MESSDKIRENLIRFRAAAGLSQEALAEMAGLSTMAITLIETGRRKTPGIGTVIKIARALGISIDELTGEKNYSRLAVARRMASTGALPNFQASADFLTILSRLSENRQRAIVAVVYDSAELVGDSALLRRAVSELLKVC